MTLLRKDFYHLLIAPGNICGIQHRAEWEQMVMNGSYFQMLRAFISINIPKWIFTKPQRDFKIYLQHSKMVGHSRGIPNCHTVLKTICHCSIWHVIVTVFLKSGQYLSWHLYSVMRKQHKNKKILFQEVPFSTTFKNMIMQSVTLHAK